MESLHHGTHRQTAWNSLFLLILHAWYFGIHKRAPSLRAVEKGEGVSDLQQSDTIHMVDADLSNQEDGSADQSWLLVLAIHTETAYEPQCNFVWFKYVMILRQFTLSFKALALNAGNCGAKSVCVFMQRNVISWYHPIKAIGTALHPQRWPSVGVICQRSVWVVDGVDMVDGTLQIYSRENASDVIVLQIADGDASFILQKPYF